jgi:glutaredoxin 2
MMISMSESEKPLSLKKLITELGFSGDLKRTCLLLKALRADSCEKPKLLMRYDTANGYVSDSDAVVVVAIVAVVVVQYLNDLSEIGNEQY